MRVKLATQVFSHSVAAAMQTAISTGELKSKTALNTANFVETINNLFDALNSKSLKNRNPHKRALTSKDDAVRKTLLSGLSEMKNVKKIIHKKDGSKTETVPPSFTGMQQSISAILNLFEDEHKNGVKFIMTYRLNQDVIENLFGLYRIKTGCNRNPTAKQLRSIFRNHLLNGLITMNTGNCEDDEDKFILEEMDCSDIGFSAGTEETSFCEKSSSEESESKAYALHAEATTTLQSTATEPVMVETTLEDCSIAYFAGYLAKKCIEKYNCQKCITNLLKHEEILTDPKQMLILNKNYGVKELALKAPSEMLYEIVKKV